MFKKLLWFSSTVLISIVISPMETFAHGVVLEYEKVRAIALVAQYDTGQPMSNAQVIIHAPNNTEEPYLRGIADENGNFSFTPDQNIIGNWTVRVTTAGHGNTINIPVEFDSQTVISGNNPINNSEKSHHQPNQNSPQTQGQSSPHTAAQKLLMAVSGVWGFVGTALFFSRPKT